jgi:hypothetical protein
MSKTNKIRLKKTRIVLEVLSPVDQSPGDVDKETLFAEITTGGWSGISTVSSTRVLSGKKAERECLKQGTDPDFFLDADAE